MYEYGPFKSGGKKVLNVPVLIGLGGVSCPFRTARWTSDYGKCCTVRVGRGPRGWGRS